MKPHKSTRRLFLLLTLAVLLLAACQPAVAGTTNLPTEPAIPTAQPVGADTEAPISEPTETSDATGTTVPAEPTEAAPQASPTSEVLALPPTGVQAPEGWLVLDNPNLGYSLAYPAEWEICQETKYSRAFCEIQEEPEGMGPPPRLYVSVVPQDYTNHDWEVYNFTSNEIIQEFLASPVGESILKAPASPASDYYTYTRLTDQMVAGRTALLIENSKVWEAPPGTKDRVLFIVSEGSIVHIGAYYETPEQLAMFEQVLDSFQFAP